MEHKNKNFQKTLLLIDDIPDNLTVLQAFLRNREFKILVATNGKQGIKVAEYALPDLILLDVMMPGMNGFEVCQYLKSQEKTRAIPIIFMTALSETIDKIRGFEVGAADYITKPFQQEEVLARVNAHIMLQHQHKQLQKQNMELDAFAHTVAHDLKNPISAMINLTGMFLENYSPEKPFEEKWRKRLEFVEQAGQRTINTINALLKLAGVSRQTDWEVTPLNMKEITQRVLDQLLPTLKTTDLNIQQPDHWPVALGYAPWIEEVWMNYLSNAFKYGGQPLHLILGSDVQENGKIRFWVQDNGQGLSPEAQSKLFTPFTRLHRGRVDGHGLGLSIVQQIIEKLGGEVGLESTLEKGSLFYFTLPAAN